MPAVNDAPIPSIVITISAPTIDVKEAAAELAEFAALVALVLALLAELDALVALVLALLAELAALVAEVLAALA